MFLAFAELAVVDVGWQVDGAPVHDTELAAFFDVLGRGDEGCYGKNFGDPEDDESNYLQLHLEKCLFRV